MNAKQQKAIYVIIYAPIQWEVIPVRVEMDMNNQLQVAHLAQVFQAIFILSCISIHSPVVKCICTKLFIALTCIGVRGKLIIRVRVRGRGLGGRGGGGEEAAALLKN